MSSKFTLRSALLARGLTLRAFARLHNFPESYVLVCVHRYWGKNVSPRSDSLAARIMDLLHEVLR